MSNTLRPAAVACPECSSWAMSPLTLPARLQRGPIGTLTPPARKLVLISPQLQAGVAVRCQRRAARPARRAAGPRALAGRPRPRGAAQAVRRGLQVCGCWAWLAGRPGEHLAGFLNRGTRGVPGCDVPAVRRDSVTHCSVPCLTSCTYCVVSLCFHLCAGTTWSASTCWRAAQ